MPEEILRENDRNDHPSYYTNKQVEVIDYIWDTLTPEEFTGFCTGNILKYISRWRHKGGVEDLKKARSYLDWVIAHAEKFEEVDGDGYSEDGEADYEDSGNCVELDETERADDRPCGWNCGECDGDSAAVQECPEAE